MIALLRRLFGGNPRKNSESRPLPPLDPIYQKQLDEYERQKLQDAQDARDARETDHLLEPRDRIKKRLHLKSELPADYKRPNPEGIPVLSLNYPSHIPMIVVVNRTELGLSLPLALFGYLYREQSLSPDELKLVNFYLSQLGVQPISS